jgi:hypothetical protein
MASSSAGCTRARLADVDGDGLKDIVTGKRWWSHGTKGDPDGGSVPAVAYAFLLKRPAKGEVRYVAKLLDDDSGVGTQVVAGDVTGDGRTDVVIGNKKGTFLLRHCGDAQAPPAPPIERNRGDPKDGGSRASTWTSAATCATGR